MHVWKELFSNYLCSLLIFFISIKLFIRCCALLNTISFNVFCELSEIMHKGLPRSWGRKFLRIGPNRIWLWVIRKPCNVFHFSIVLFFLGIVLIPGFLPQVGDIESSIVSENDDANNENFGEFENMEYLDKF